MLYGYLFYSMLDNGYCKNLITLIERHGLSKLFKLQLIDNMNDEQITKLGLQTVPTLLVISENGQQKQQFIYEGNEAFKWVDTFLISRRQNIMKDAESSRRLIQNNNTKDRLTQRLYEYCESEHSGISDAYAYYNEDEKKDINVAQSKMFSHGLSYQNDNIGAIPLSGNGKIKDYKAKEGLTATYGNEQNLKKAIDRINDERNKQDDKLKQNIELDTIKMIIQKSNN